MKGFLRQTGTWSNVARTNPRTANKANAAVSKRNKKVLLNGSVIPTNCAAWKTWTAIQGCSDDRIPASYSQGKCSTGNSPNLVCAKAMIWKCSSALE